MMEGGWTKGWIIIFGVMRLDKHLPKVCPGKFGLTIKKFIIKELLSQNFVHLQELLSSSKTVFQGIWKLSILGMCTCKCSMFKLRHIPYFLSSNNNIEQKKHSIHAR
jgi:hypothetical protein